MANLAPRDSNLLLKDDEERRKTQLNARYTFSWDKPLHENGWQIGVSLEQIGAVTILAVFDCRSNILICCRNRPDVTKEKDLHISLLDYYSRRCILRALSRGYRLPPGRIQKSD